MHARLVLAVALTAAIPAIAHAQSVTSPPDAPAGVLAGDYIIVGAGAFYSPSYEGSNNYTVSPAPLIQGQIHGIAISPRPGGIGLDFIPDAPHAKIGFQLGPVVTYSRDRAHNIQDPVVLAAGRLKSAIDVGVSPGVTVYRLTNPYDSLTLSGDVKWNVNGASKGMQVIPSLTYVTPVSKAMLVTIGASAKHVDSDYAHYYYDVSPAQSLGSGLPLYAAHAGWESVGANLLVGYDLDGNLLNGGFAVFALGSYNKLMNDAKYTPYTALRGSSNQWVVGAGVAYTFGL